MRSQSLIVCVTLMVEIRMVSIALVNAYFYLYKLQPNHQGEVNTNFRVLLKSLLIASLVFSKIPGHLLCSSSDGATYDQDMGNQFLILP
jgi:uncharacterized protein YigA (DUF484 family)